MSGEGLSSRIGRRLQQIIKPGRPSCPLFPQEITQGVATSAHEAVRVLYRTKTIGGVEVFYREAGPKTDPAMLLLHGFPTSSHMFRALIPTLADSTTSSRRICQALASQMCLLTSATPTLPRISRTRSRSLLKRLASTATPSTFLIRRARRVSPRPSQSGAEPGDHFAKWQCLRGGFEL